MKLTSENREERSEEGSSEVEETKADEVGKLNSSSEDEAEQSKETKAHGDLRGGATESYWEEQTYSEMFLTAIGRAQLPLRLDEDTIGDGNCFPRAMVQQFQRPQVKLFLQSRGINIPDYMSLRRKVVHFARRNMHTRQFQTMRENYDFTQENLAEDETPRTWEQYWVAMLVDREWPDNFFIQACAWYLQMNIVIVYAGHATPEKPIHPIEGTFNSAKTGPSLLVGYITNQHYQSLLPLEEDRSLPTYLAPAAMNSTLEDVLNALGCGKATKDSSKPADVGKSATKRRSSDPDSQIFHSHDPAKTPPSKMRKVVPDPNTQPANQPEDSQGEENISWPVSDSYTHLTLPTICSV